MLSFGIDNWEVLSLSFSMVFPFWPLILLSGLIQWRGRNFTRLFVAMLFIWVIIAIMRVIIAIRSAPIFSFLLPEPASTIAFVICGPILVALLFLVRRWEQRHPSWQPSKRRTSPKRIPTESQNIVGHPNISILIARMESALLRADYAGVLQASASVFETLAKDVVGIATVQDRTLKQFFDRYRKDSALPPEMLDYILSIYEKRNVTPLAGHGSTRKPAVTKQEAITLSEMTKAFVNMEYKARQKS